MMLLLKMMLLVLVQAFAVVVRLLVLVVQLLLAVVRRLLAVVLAAGGAPHVARLGVLDPLYLTLAQKTHFRQLLGQ